MGDIIDSKEKELVTDVIKCKSCGANMTFDAISQKLFCEHCGTSIDFEKDKNIYERNFDVSNSEDEQWSEALVIRCNNCGSSEVVSKTDLSRICPFCGTANIITTDSLPGIKPHAVFPFTVSKQDCLTSVKKWIRKKWYVPSKCKKEFAVENINGVYTPCWTIDSETVSYYDGVLGRTVIKTVGSGKNARTVTEVKYFKVNGVIQNFYDDIMVEASPKIDQTTFNKIRPFNTQCACVYDKKFLAGFMANHYDKDVNYAFGIAKSVMDKDIKNNIMQKHGATLVQSLNVKTSYNNIKYKYILLPIWVGNYKYKNVLFNYYVNGNTSKIVGKVPKSALKIAGAVLIGAALVAGGFVAYYFLSQDEMTGSYDNSYTIQENIFSQNSYELDGYKLIY